ncbi:MAG: hypothetical protein AB2608_17945 [Candidatus Thiodiazotropha sp.]
MESGRSRRKHTHAKSAFRLYTSKKNPIAHSAKWVKVKALPIFFWSKVFKTSHALDRQHIYLPAEAKKYRGYAAVIGLTALPM